MLYVYFIHRHAAYRALDLAVEINTKKYPSSVPLLSLVILQTIRVFGAEKDVCCWFDFWVGNRPCASLLCITTSFCCTPLVSLSLDWTDHYSVQKIYKKKDKIIIFFFTSFVRFAHFSINLLSSQSCFQVHALVFVHSHTHEEWFFWKVCLCRSDLTLSYLVDYYITYTIYSKHIFQEQFFLLSVSQWIFLNFDYITYFWCWQIFVPCYLFFLFVFFFIHYCVYDSQLPKLLTMSTTHLILRGGELYQHTKYLSISVSISVSSYTYTAIYTLYTAKKFTRYVLVASEIEFLWWWLFFF